MEIQDLLYAFFHCFFIVKTSGMNIRYLHNFQPFESRWKVIKRKRNPSNLIIVFIGETVYQRCNQGATDADAQPAEKCRTRNTFVHLALSFSIPEKYFSYRPLNDATDIVHKKKNRSQYFGKEKSDDGYKYIIAQVFRPTVCVQKRQQNK